MCPVTATAFGNLESGWQESPPSFTLQYCRGSALRMAVLHVEARDGRIELVGVQLEILGDRRLEILPLHRDEGNALDDFLRDELPRFKGTEGFGARRLIAALGSGSGIKLPHSCHTPGFFGRSETSRRL